MYGRQFLPYSEEAFDAKFYIVYYVYGSHECQECDRCGIYVEFYGNRTAGGGDHLGEYAFPVGKGAFVQFLVDHSDPGALSGHDAGVYHKSGKLSAQECESRGE